MKTRLASLLMIGAALYARPGRAAGGALADAQEGHEGHEGHEGEDVRPMDVVVTAQIVTLTEAMRSARAHQPALEMARGNVVTAWGQADQVRAALLPQLNGNASYSRGTNNYVPSVGGTTPGAQTISSSFTTYARWYSSLTLSQMIYDFGETINKWQAAVAAAQAMDQTVSITEFQIDYNTRFAFFTARAAKELVGVARDNLANQEKHLAQVKGFVEVGTHPEIDLTQAKADRATAELQLITAETNYATAKANLNQAMGVERSIDYELSDEDSPPVAGEDGAVEALVGEADHDRPEMRNLYLNLKSQEFTLRSAHDQIWPQLTLSGNLNDAGPDHRPDGMEFQRHFLDQRAFHPGRGHPRRHQAGRGADNPGQVAGGHGALAGSSRRRAGAARHSFGKRVDRCRRGCPGQLARSSAPGRGTLSGRGGEHHRAGRRPGGARHRRGPAGAGPLSALHRSGPAGEGLGAQVSCAPIERRAATGGPSPHRFPLALLKC